MHTYMKEEIMWRVHTIQKGKVNKTDVQLTKSEIYKIFFIIYSATYICKLILKLSSYS
jgi:hypothetical protein